MLGGVWSAFVKVDTVVDGWIDIDELKDIFIVGKTSEEYSLLTFWIGLRMGCNCMKGSTFYEMGYAWQQTTRLIASKLPRPWLSAIVGQILLYWMKGCSQQQSNRELWDGKDFSVTSIWTKNKKIITNGIERGIRGKFIWDKLQPEFKNICIKIYCVNQLEMPIFFHLRYILVFSY